MAPFVEQGVGLAIGVAPPEHRVDVEADVREAADRVRLVLRGHHDARPPGTVHGVHGLRRAGEEVGAGHAELDVELAEAVGPACRVVGGEALAELEVEVAPEQGVEHVVAGDRGAGLGLERLERGDDARPRVDQGHVEVEPDDQLRHRLDAYRTSGSSTSHAGVY